jgi:hypothetical protein
MRPFLIITIILTLTSVQAKAEFPIDEKTNDYVIIKAGTTHHRSEQHSRYSTINKILHDENDPLNKSFRSADNHCSSLKKRTYMFYRTQTVGRGFGPQTEFLFDHLKGGWNAKYRFFCADNEEQARSLFKSIAFSEENLKEFRSWATTGYSPNFPMNVLMRQTEEVRKINEEKEAKIFEENQKKSKLIAEENEKKLKLATIEEKKRKDIEKFSLLEKDHGKNCSRFQKNVENFKNCLLEQENKTKEAEAKKFALKQDQEKKKVELDKQRKLEEEKANRLLASMKPEERRSYICEKTYGFRKGSDKFSECVYKILAADVELEKLELQKKLAEAQLETARANEAAARANAAASASTRNVPAYDPAIGRAAERANEIETARLAFELARQLNPQRYVPQQQNNIQLPKQQYCKLNPINNRISCYTTP